MCRSEEEGTEETNGNIEMPDRAVINQAGRDCIIICFYEYVVERDVAVAEIKGVEEVEIMEDGEEIREMKMECIFSGRVFTVWIVEVQRLSFPSQEELA